MSHHSGLFANFPQYLSYQTSEESQSTVSIDILTQSTGIGTAMAHTVTYQNEDRVIFKLNALTQFDNASAAFNWHKVNISWPSGMQMTTLLERDQYNHYTVGQELYGDNDKSYTWSEYLGHSDMISIPYSQWCEGLFIVSAMQFKQGDALPRLMLPTHYAREYGFEKFFALLKQQGAHNVGITAVHKHALVPSMERMCFIYEDPQDFIPQQIHISDRKITLWRQLSNSKSAISMGSIRNSPCLSKDTFPPLRQSDTYQIEAIPLSWNGQNLELHVNTTSASPIPSLFLYDFIRTAPNTIGTQFRRQQILQLAQQHGVRICYLDFFIGPGTRIGSHPPIAHNILMDLSQEVIRQVSQRFHNLAVLAVGEAGNFLASLVAKLDQSNADWPLVIFDNPVFHSKLNEIFEFHEPLIDIQLTNIFNQDIVNMSHPFWICAWQMPEDLSQCESLIKTQHPTLLSHEYQDPSDLIMLFDLFKNAVLRKSKRLDNKTL